MPKDSIIFPNLYAMHINPKGDFPVDPLTFDPEKHFMKKDENDKTIAVKPQGMTDTTDFHCCIF